MKNIRQDSDDLRPECRRADLGKMVRGKYAFVELDFAEYVRLLMACIGEDEDLRFTDNSPASLHGGRRQGDWTYELDNLNRITLRYWFSEFGNVEELIARANSPYISTPQERADLQNLLVHHVRVLKARVAAL